MIATSVEFMAGALSFVVTGTHLFAYYTFNKQIDDNRTKPNLTVWILLFFLTITNATSYWQMTHDWIKTLHPFSGACASLFTVRKTVRKGEFHYPGIPEFIATLFVVFALFMWKFSDVSHANLLLQGGILSALSPLVYRAYKDPRKEDSRAYKIWTVAFFFSFFVVLMTYKHWFDFGYAVAGFCVNFALAFLTREKRKKFFESPRPVTGRVFAYTQTGITKKKIFGYNIEYEYARWR